MWIQSLFHRRVYVPTAGVLEFAVISDLVLQRPRKYEDEQNLRMENAQGILEYDVSVVSARYDEEQHKWMYTLNDWQNERIAGETPETKLG